MWDIKVVFPGCLVFLESMKRKRTKKKICRKRTQKEAKEKTMM